MKKDKLMLRFATSCIVTITLLTSPPAYCARFLPLGYLDEAGDYSFGEGISANGETIVGTSNNKPFRWTEAEGMVCLGDFPWVSGGVQVFGISGDGNVIFGTTSINEFQWTQAAGYQEIIPGPMHPSGISFDGSVYSVLPDTDISADGTITVGFEVHIFGDEAYRDSPNDCGCTTRQWLGDLPGGDYQSIAHAVSANGKVVVGQSQSLYDDGMGTIHEVVRPFYWTEEHGIIALEQWSQGTASDVSANGLVVIGAGGEVDGGNWASYRWTPATGMASIRELLLAEGIDLDAMGWILNNLRGVSANGRVIVGTGTNPSGHAEAYLIELPVPGDFDEDGDSDGADFLAWQRGESHHPMSPSDLEDWQANFTFFSNAAGASANAVPEPGALLLGLMCALAMFGVRFQK